MLNSDGPIQITALTDPRAPLDGKDAGATSAAAQTRAARLPHLRGLTSIRFFAALHVALFHLVQPVTLWGPLAAFMGSGYTAVSFFFVLSGFILTYSHSQDAAATRGRPVSFWMARVARIYPVYVLSLLFAFFVHHHQLQEPSHWVLAVLNLFMLQSWIAHTIYLFNVPAWSLSVEAFFYLLFPFLLLRLRPARRVQALTLLAGFWLLAMAAPLLCILVDPGPSIHGTWTGRTHPLLNNVSRVPLFALPEFLAGIVLGWYHLYFRPTRGVAVLLTLTGAAGLLLCCWLGTHLPVVMMNNGLLIPFTAMLILGLAQDHALTRAISGDALVLLGEASFALYLFHFLIGEYARNRFGLSSSLGSGLLQVLISIGLALLAHLCVERPARRSILHWWRTRSATLTQAR